MAHVALGLKFGLCRFGGRGEMRRRAAALPDGKKEVRAHPEEVRAAQARHDAAKPPGGLEKDVKPHHREPGPHAAADGDAEDAQNGLAARLAHGRARHEEEVGPRHHQRDELNDDEACQEGMHIGEGSKEALPDLD